MASWLNRESLQEFKIGDYFYLNQYGKIIKLKSQEVINIKLGITNVKAKKNWPVWMYQVIEITNNQLFYNPHNVIKAR